MLGILKFEFNYMACLEKIKVGSSAGPSVCPLSFQERQSESFFVIITILCQKETMREAKFTSSVKADKGNGCSRARRVQEETVTGQDEETGGDKVRL